MKIYLLALFLALAASPALMAQRDTASVEVVGTLKQSLRLTAEDLSKMPRASVETRSDGVSVTYAGVWLTDVLKKAGVPAGTELRGKTLASYLLVTAEDGYEVVFSLAELDSMFGAYPVLLVDSANGKPLPGAEGPFRLVVPKDERGARSVRMLKKIEVVFLRK